MLTQWRVFGVLVFTYFLIMSGVVYDINRDAESMGVTIDPRTGSQKPEIVRAGTLNEQHSIEGFACVPPSSSACACVTAAWRAQGGAAVHDGRHGLRAARPGAGTPLHTRCCRPKRSRVAAPAALRGRSAAGAQDVQKEVKTRIVNLIAGCAMVVLSYNLVMLFLRIKVPSLYVYPNA